MTAYQAFKRGLHPVGVSSREISYSENKRCVPVEIWYPATASHAGEDLDPKLQDKFSMAQGFPEVSQNALRNAEALPGKFPLIVFSHGFAGHRRQTTHLCCHLASHGYLVIAPDHVGNTLLDIMNLASTLQEKGFDNMEDLFKSFKQDRPQDALHCIEAMLDNSLGFEADENAIGICGHSFGGWTSLATANLDKRIKAVVPLAPAGGQSKRAISNTADFSLGTLDFGEETPCLYLVADQDTLLPLDSMEDLFKKTPSPKRMLILENSDHFHFCDNVEFIHDAMINMGSALFGQDNQSGVLSKMKPSSELCSGESAYTFLQAACLAHMDAFVSNEDKAKVFLEEELLPALEKMNIQVHEYC